MKRNGIKGCLLIFVVCLLALLSIKAWAEDIYPSSPPLFTDQELDNLLAPIALYPDPLLAQMLPASTYTEEIADAYDWLGSSGAISEIDRQNWDESVKAIARYPDVLKIMAENGDWTADLGDAFLNQPEAVTSSIQRLRWQAKDAGNLESNSQQSIVIVGDYIEIVPARPQYICVPTYDPSVVYAEGGYSGGEPFITFGVGLMIGGWLTMDLDWDNHHVIYHGWKRPGWVNHARPYVHVDNVYVHKSKPYINNNWRHDASHGTPDSYRTARPGGGSGAGIKSRMFEIKGRSVTTAPTPPSQNVKKQPAITVPSVSQRPAPRVPDVSQRPEMPAPVVGKGTTQSRPAGESLQRSRTPSVTFGGYRGGDEAKGQSLRGQASRQSSEKSVRSSTTPAAKGNAPEKNGGSRGNAPEGKENAGDKSRR